MLMLMDLVLMLDGYIVAIGLIIRLVEDGGRHKIFNSIPISVYWHRFFQLTTTEPKSVDESYGMFRNNFSAPKIDTQGLLIANDSKEEARIRQEGEEAEYSNILCKIRFGGATKKK
ncbi:hypothetical protein G4B88_011075 [Cannabis sativa]|uniref:Uncharacterized protein n=1 Tax=Cannabis sativa TaxID=3483 RepID=A0A7J6FAS1_CANSA|nr:hypothetical protein G4B88_011075 [Cannabis sativa]